VDPRAARASWLTTTLAMLSAVPMYAVVAWVLSSAEARPDGSMARQLQAAFQIAGPLAALAGAAWMRLRVIHGVTPQQFLTDSLIATSLAEVPAILGLIGVLAGGRFEDFVWMAAISVIVIGGVVIPAGLRWWADRESGGPG
jgi:hypothetical protein